MARKARKHVKALVGNAYIFDRTGRDILSLTTTKLKKNKKVHGSIFDIRLDDTKGKNLAKSIIGGGKRRNVGNVLGGKEDRRLTKSILS